jgi:hypothetical protein
MLVDIISFDNLSPPFYLELNNGLVSLPTAGVRLKAVPWMNQWEVWSGIRYLCWGPSFIVVSFFCRVEVEPNLLSPFYLSDSSPTYFYSCLLVFCSRSFTRSLELSSRTHRGFICPLFAFFRNLKSYSYSFVSFCVSAHPLFSFSLTLLVPLLSTLYHERQGMSLSFPVLLRLLVTVHQTSRLLERLFLGSGRSRAGKRAESRLPRFVACSVFVT